MGRFAVTRVTSLAITECGNKSVAANTFINAKIEMKKLNFNIKKCHQIHVGKTNVFCPVLQVHGESVSVVREDSYLGDTVADHIQVDGSNSKNVAARNRKGISIVSQIMSVLQTVTLGHYYFESGFLLRQSQLIGGMLFNAEVWYGLTKAQVEKLEEPDKMLLRRIFETPISTPIECLYLESGSIPVEFILRGRRIMYFHYLVTREKCEMLHKFFKVQWEHPTKYDWTETVKDDFEFFGLDLDIEKIQRYKKVTFSKIVQNKVRNVAFEYLLDKKALHSKMDGIVYDNKFKVQPYLSDRKVNPSIAKLLFKFRCRMINVKMNFKRTYSEFNCPLCLENGEFHSDSQENLLTCTVLKQHSTVLANNKTVKYSTIFSKQSSC